MKLALEIPDDLIETIARQAAALLTAQADRADLPSPYVTTDQAAEHLRCSRQRIHDLLSQGRLTRLKEGRRTLLLRSELDELVQLDRHRRVPQ